MHRRNELLVVIAGAVISAVNQDVFIKPFSSTNLKLNKSVVVQQLLRNRGNPHESFRHGTQQNELRSSLINEYTTLDKFRQL